MQLRCWINHVHSAEAVMLYRCWWFLLKSCLKSCLELTGRLIMQLRCSNNFVASSKADVVFRRDDELAQIRW